MPEDEYWLQGIVILANIIGFIYNLPQVILTIRTKKTDDISGTFLILRFISSILWIIYCIYTNSIDVLISWIITCSSNIVILYYKFFYKNQNVQNNIYVLILNRLIDHYKPNINMVYNNNLYLVYYQILQSPLYQTFDINKS